MIGLTIIEMLFSRDRHPYISPLYNSSIESAIPGVVCYEPERLLVVLGNGGKVEREIHVDRCFADGVEIKRRLGGGGAVVLNKGVIVLEAVLEEEKGKNYSYYFELFFYIVSDCLFQLGLKTLEFKGISDYCVGDRKIAGSCLRKSRNVVLFQMSLMITSQIRWIERYLKHPPRMPQYRFGRRHKDFVTDLESEGIRVSTSKIMEILNKKGLEIINCKQMDVFQS